MKYVTPAFLLLILGSWLWQQGLPVILLTAAPPAHLPYILATRLGLTTLFVLLLYLVRKAWRGRKPYEASP